MKRWKRLSALVLTAALLSALLTGCAEEGEGISLSVCMGGEPESLDPIYAVGTGDQTLVSHLYENLMSVTPDQNGQGTVVNGMARSADQEDNFDGTYTWTFRLKNAKWSDGVDVKAEDFVYAWKRLADPANDSPYAALMSVVAGYQEVRDTGDTSLLQVSAKNENTFQVVVNGRYEWFLSAVCTSPATMPVRQDVIAPWEEAVALAESAEKEGESQQWDIPPWWSELTSLPVNGPYRVSETAAGESITASLNKTYDSGRTPGPAELTFRFADSPEEAWALYQNKEVDAVWEVPEEELARRAEDEKYQLTPDLGASILLYNSEWESLVDPVVREALSLTVDRTAAAQAAGGTARPAEGLIPWGVPGSDGVEFRTEGLLLDNDPETYKEQCLMAEELLPNAGYHSEDLDGLEILFIDRGTSADVAQGLVQTWYDVLGIRVQTRAVAPAEMEQALEEKNYAMALVDFTAMGNDAELFLRPWSAENGGQDVAGYDSSAYNTLMSIIASASDEVARMGCLHDAEALLMDDHVLSPLYTTAMDWELRDTLTGAYRDALGWFSFAGVFTRSV